ncbi:molybdopterin-guanine dinucleotide biosynthesis protein A [Crossiella equi]|uniref:Molybdopterin-guanine dinucleotide biosynthesis protein A n=1 Tax=Crossiella equi TaxID=130796 RepID=A0ABS5AP98_9PSEU|nr:NTP transferase domain-containing protein [Crossiella equi]MBP2478251.1 molybdopterin-guanine dinucleotide biosynthesis protein A [Crossiella equi]
MDAVVLAGGRASRMRGADKPGLVLGGLSLLGHALAAVAGARHVVVVGPRRTVPGPVTWTREEPPGSGPLAGLRAGLAALEDGTGQAAVPGVSTVDGLVAVLAADQPGVTAATVSRLQRAVTEGVAGAVLLADGHRQWLSGVWRVADLRAAMPERTEGVPLRALFGRLAVAEVPAQGAEGRDVDTPADWESWRSVTGG